MSIPLFIKTVGLYPTNNAETNKFILEDCKANLLVVESKKTLDELQPYRGQLPNLKKIIVWDDEVLMDSDDVLSWEDVIKLGMEDTKDEPVLERQRNMTINQCCVLVYTSGTTGNPKGNSIVITTNTIRIRGSTNNKKV